MIRAMSAADLYARTIRQAAHDAVRALLTAPRDSAEASVALREVTAWLAHEHGPTAVLDLAEELAVDLAEAMDALAAVEQRDAVEVTDRWFHDQAAPDVPGHAADPGRPDIGG
jgi:DNA-directed RNA polymerase specialized sigma subunit